MKKKLQNQLRGIARSLPPRTYIVFGPRTPVDGFTLIKDGIKSIDGRPVEPKGGYTRARPWQKEINHYRRLRKAYNEGGIKAVDAYCVKILGAGYVSPLKEPAAV